MEPRGSKEVDVTREELGALLAALREELRTELAGPRPISVSPEQACELFGFGRSTLYRWIDDARSGLCSGPAPVVWRPNGPGGKVLVHVERMQAWLDARNRKGRSA